MKIKAQIMVKENDDQTITVVDLSNGSFFELNDTATLIFKNIDLSGEALLEMFKTLYDLPDDFSTTELVACRDNLRNRFFE